MELVGVLNRLFIVLIVLLDLVIIKLFVCAKFILRRLLPTNGIK
jgi:hypothetical protein